MNWEKYNVHFSISMNHFCLAKAESIIWEDAKLRILRGKNASALFFYVRPFRIQTTVNLASTTQSYTKCVIQSAKMVFGSFERPINNNKLRNLLDGNICMFVIVLESNGERKSYIWILPTLFAEASQSGARMKCILRIDHNVRLVGNYGIGETGLTE